MIKKSLLILLSFLAIGFMAMGCSVSGGSDDGSPAAPPIPLDEEIEKVPESFPGELLPGRADVDAQILTLYDSVTLAEQKLFILNFCRKAKQLDAATAVRISEAFLSALDARPVVNLLLDTLLSSELSPSERSRVIDVAARNALVTKALDLAVETVKDDNSRYRSLVWDEMVSISDRIFGLDGERNVEAETDRALAFVMGAKSFANRAEGADFLELMRQPSKARDEKEILSFRLSAIEDALKHTKLYQLIREGLLAGGDRSQLFSALRYMSSLVTTAAKHSFVENYAPYVLEDWNPIALKESLAFEIDLLTRVTDLSGRPLKYSLSCEDPCPNWMTLVGTRLAGAPPHDYVDSNGERRYEKLEIQVKNEFDRVSKFGLLLSVENVDRGVIVSAPSLLSTKEGILISGAVSAVDADADPTQIRCIKGCPANLILNQVSGEFTWTPSYNDAGEILIVWEATSKSSTGVTSAQTTTKIVIENVNLAPKIVKPADVNVNEGEVLTFPVSFSDPDGKANLRVFCDQNTGGVCPENLSISNDGILTYKPNYNVAGALPVISKTFTIGLTVTDGFLSESTTFKIVVDNTNRGPSISSNTHFTINELDEIYFVLSSSDPDIGGGVGSYSCEAGCPDEASFIVESGTGQVYWRPGYFSDGEYSITFRVKDGEASDEIAVGITVENLVRAPLPFQSSTDLVMGYVGNTAECLGQTTDPDMETIYYTYLWEVSDTLGSEANFQTISGATAKKYKINAAAVRHQFIRCTITADDRRGGVTVASPSAAVKILNTDPEPFAAALDSLNAVVHDTLGCYGESSDIDLDDLFGRYTYKWFKSSAALGPFSEISGETDSVLLVTATHAHSFIICEMTVSDGYGGFRASSRSSPSAEILNTRPNDFISTTSTSSQRVSFGVSCLGETTDEDEDDDGILDEPISYSYAWFVADSPSATNEAWLQLSSETTNTYIIKAEDARHAFVRCQITAADTHQGVTISTWSSPVTVENTPPMAFSSTIDKATAKVGHDLFCSGQTTDIDLDTLGQSQYSYRFLLLPVSGGAMVEVSGFSPSNIVSVTSGEAHGTIFCEVRVSDLYGGWTVSSLSPGTSILNTLPDPFGASLNKSSALVSETLTCSGSTSDIDGDEFPALYTSAPVPTTPGNGYTFAWYVDSSEAGTFTEQIPNAISNTYALENSYRNRFFKCEMTAWDGFGGVVTSAKSSSAAYINTAPANFTATTDLSSAKVGDTITCGGSTSDVDADPLTYPANSHRWYFSDSSGGPFDLLGGLTGETFTVTSTYARGFIKCDRLADDSRAQTRSSTSAFITVTNTAPLYTAGTGNKSVTEDQTLTFDVKTSDADQDDVSISCAGCPSGSSFIQVFGVGYRFTWKPSTSVSTFSSNAVFNITLTATDGYGGLTTTAFSITVINLPRPPTISLSCPSSVNETSAVTVTYSINDADNDPMTVTHLSGFPSTPTHNTTAFTFSLAGSNGHVFHSDPYDSSLRKWYKNWTVTLRVSAGDGSNQTSCTIKVIDVDRAPTGANATTNGNLNGCLNYSFPTSSVTDLDGDAKTIEWGPLSCTDGAWTPKVYYTERMSNGKCLYDYNYRSEQKSRTRARQYRVKANNVYSPWYTSTVSNCAVLAAAENQLTISGCAANSSLYRYWRDNLSAWNGWKNGYMITEDVIVISKGFAGCH